MPKKSNAVTKQPETKMKKIGDVEAIAGFEYADNEMLIIPRVKLLQGISAEVEELDIPAGTFINSVTKEVIAKKGESFKFIPLLVRRSRIKFKPMKDGGGISCIARDGLNGAGEPGTDCYSCPNRQWGEGNEQPECTEYINFAVFPVINDKIEEGLPVIVSFGRTSFNVGKQLVTIAQSKRKNPWMFVYEMSAKYIDSDKGKYYSPKIGMAGESPVKLIEKLEDAYEMMTTVDYTPHYDEDEIKREQVNVETAAESGKASEDDTPF